MNNLLTLALFLARSLKRYFWAILLASVAVYFLYQTTFSWGSDQHAAATQTITGEDEVVLLIMKEHHYGVKRNDFKSLSERLKTWEFQEDQQQVLLKFESLFPKADTKVMLIYDRSFDSFQHYSEVLPVASFPYQVALEEEPILTVHEVGQDGSVFLNFKGKRIKLGAHDSYPTELSIKDFQLVRTTIVNHGIYKKNQFLPLDPPKNKQSDADSSKTSGGNAAKPDQPAPPLDNIEE